MRILYFECNMGAAGDMLMASLLELLPNQDKLIDKLNSLGIPKVRYQKESVMKCGITGTHITVTVDGVEEKSDDVHFHHHHEHHSSHHHTHTKLQDIKNIISGLNVSQAVKDNAAAVYEEIAAAESYVHNKKVEEIHFHEVGTMDAVADVVGVCFLIEQLSVDKIIASPIHVGGGQVYCAHGVLPVPAPATAYILKDIPIYSGGIRKELCTPTGAALLKHFCSEFGDMPVMRLENTGYGMGTKDFEAANCVRAMLGECDGTMASVVELCCNLDDLTPEKLGFVTELLMQEGALDVYTTSVQMKKNRPGVVLSCMCKVSEKEKFLRLIFKHTTTLGIREYLCSRYVLDREMSEFDTPYGKVHIKKSSGYGVSREKIEYEDIAKIAREQGISLTEVENRINGDKNE